jgi:flagellar export protein FliJ
MRRFRFRLEGAHRVREIVVRERELGLARARRELEAASESRRAAEEKVRSALEAPRPTVISVSRLIEQDAEQRRLLHELRREQEHLSEWSARVEDERALLLEARRDVKAVEKLRERRYLEFLREVIRQEQKGVDEVAARTFRERRAA